MAGPFTAGILNSLASWLTPQADPQGAHANLLASKGAMFDPVAQIVMEQGSPDGQLIGQTTAPIANTGPITSIPIGSALMTVAAGQPVMIVAPGLGTVWEQFTASASVAKGAVSVGVTSQTPRNSYPTGSFVQLGYLAGWSTLLDPDLCPTQFLPYLAQFVGVQVPPNTPDAQARQIIKAESGFQRGTPAAIISAVQRNLSSPQFVALLERAGGTGVQPNGNAGSAAYNFQIVVRPAQVATSVAQITSDVNNVKPAGLTFQVIVTDLFIFNQAINTFSADTGSWTSYASSQP